MSQHVLSFHVVDSINAGKHLLIQDFPVTFSPQLPYRRNLVSRVSSTSSSDIAPSLDESIESGPLSDLQSEDDEGRRSADRRLQLTAPPVDGRGGAPLVQRLLEDIQNQDKDPDVWRKMEVWTLFFLSVSVLALLRLSLSLCRELCHSQNPTSHLSLLPKRFCRHLHLLQDDHQYGCRVVHYIIACFSCH